jgi:hypothetical protein
VTRDVRNAIAFQSSFVFAARREGMAIGLPRRLVWEAGDQYRAGTGLDHVLIIRNPEDPPLPGSRLVARNRAVSVMLMPWSPSTSRSLAP